MSITLTGTPAARAAQKKARDIKAVIERGELDFRAAAIRYSDAQNALEGGDIGFVADATVTVDGAPSKGGPLRSDADETGPSVIAFDDGKGLATVIARGGRRVHDNEEAV